MRSKNKNKKKILPIICTTLLLAFTAYVLLDTFVITRVYAQVEVPSDTVSSDVNITGSSISSDDTETSDTGELEESGYMADSTESSAEASSEENDMTTEEAYSEETTTEETEAETTANETSITIEEYNVNDTTVYVADIVLSSADELKTALAQNAYGKNITAKTSEIAEANNATLAINGDYYGSRNSGYVVRNGVIYRDTASNDQEDLVIYSDGSFEIINESEVSLYDLDTENIAQILSFGPALLESGEIAVIEDEEVGKAMASNPRTAIGIIDELHYVFVVSDGRTNESEGLSIHELAEFMQSLGVTTAYNLDGGGSSTMYYNGEIVNNPTTNGNKIKERSVSDIIYISAE